MSDRAHRLKRPAFQFYPSDWQGDTALRSCSIAARGLWMDMLCLMHEGEPYGHLRVGAKVIDATTLARMVGEAPRKVAGWLAELEAAGVFSRAADGAVYSRRMVKDEHIRQVRSDAGKLGGNPALTSRGPGQPAATGLDNQPGADDAHLDKQPDNQSPTPSTSTSASTSPSGDLEPVVVAARTIVAALNRGLAEHEDPRRRQLEPVRASAPASADATRALLEAGVPVAFAEATVYALARAHTAEGRIYSLGYFSGAVVRAWEAHGARRDADAAVVPVTTGARPAPGRRYAPRPTPGELTFARALGGAPLTPSDDPAEEA